MENFDDSFSMLIEYFELEYALIIIEVSKKLFAETWIHCICNAKILEIEDVNCQLTHTNSKKKR